MTATLAQALDIVATGRLAVWHSKRAWMDAAMALEAEYSLALTDANEHADSALDLIDRLNRAERHYDEALATIARLQLERDTLRAACDGYVVEATQAIRRLKELENEMGATT